MSASTTQPHFHWRNLFGPGISQSYTTKHVRPLLCLHRAGTPGAGRIPPGQVSAPCLGSAGSDAGSCRGRRALGPVPPAWLLLESSRGGRVLPALPPRKVTHPSKKALRDLQIGKPLRGQNACLGVHTNEADHTRTQSSALLKITPCEGPHLSTPQNPSPRGTSGHTGSCKRQVGPGRSPLQLLGAAGGCSRPLLPAWCRHSPEASPLVPNQTCPCPFCSISCATALTAVSALKPCPLHF